MTHFSVLVSRGSLTAGCGLALVAASLAFGPAATAVVHRVAVTGGIYTSNGQVTQNCGVTPPGTALYGEAVGYAFNGDPLCEASALGTGMSNGAAFAKCAIQPFTYGARIVARVPSTQHFDSLVDRGGDSFWPTSTGPGLELRHPFTTLTGACSGSYMKVTPAAVIFQNN